MHRLTDLFSQRGIPEHIRSDNEAEFMQKRYEELFDTLLEAKVLVERWRREYNQIRPPTLLKLTLEVDQSMGTGQ